MSKALVKQNRHQERQELSKRDQSLVMVAALTAMNCPEQLRDHLDRALDNGLKQEELIEVITHLAYYSGWPNPMTAINDCGGAIFKEAYLHLNYTCEDNSKGYDIWQRK